MNAPVTEFFNAEGLINKETFFVGNDEVKLSEKKLQEYRIDTALFIFHKYDMSEILDANKLEEIYAFKNASNKNLCYIYDKKFVIALAPLGGASAGMMMEELGFMGIKNFFASGSAGQIDHSKDSSEFVLVEKAIRSEGTSYHYLAPSVYVETNEELTNFIAAYLERNNFKYNKSFTWTTDAFYRETKKELERRVEQGAVSVEMECASWAAIAKFRGYKFAQLLYFSDAVKQGWAWKPDKNEIKKMVISLMLSCVTEFVSK